MCITVVLFFTRILVDVSRFINQFINIGTWEVVYQIIQLPLLIFESNMHVDNLDTLSPVAVLCHCLRG